jgi:hypothetical protein
MAESPIIRSPTEEERKDFIPIADPRKRGKNAKEKFEEELCNHQQEAAKKGLPFCDRAVKDDFNDYYKNQVQTHTRKYGYVKVEEIKPIKMDWNKYSDLKNFELLEEGERFDEHLTKINPGLTVMIKWTRYKYRDYENEYMIMESGSDAINRAKKKLKE